MSVPAGPVADQLAELESIYRTAPIGLLFVDTDLRYVRINERMAAINGVPVDEHLGRTIFEVLPEIAAIVAPNYRQVIASGEPMIGKAVRGTTKAHPGEERDYLVNYCPVRNADGRVVGVTAVVQEVTAQTQAVQALRESEAALRHSERQFALFMQNLPGAAWIKDLDGRYVYANQTAERIFQTRLDDLLGKTDGQVFPPDTAAQFQANDRLALSSASQLLTVETLPQPDGVHYSVVSKFPILDAAGDAALIGGIAIDITAQHQAEESRREIEENFRIVAETAADGIVRIDEQSRILYANAALEKTFGYATGELTGGSLTVLMPDYLRHVHEAALRSYLRTGQKHLNWDAVELPGLHKSGREIPLEVSFGELVKDGKHLFSGIIRDVTARKRSERRLATQYAVTRVLSEFSHLGEIAPRILQAVGESLGWRMGAFWTVDSATRTMRCVETWQGTSPTRSAFEMHCRNFSFPKGTGLPGRIWAIGKAAWIPDLSADGNFPRAPFAMDEGFHSAFGFPILRNAEVLGVMEFFSPEIREPDTELLHALEVIGRQIGHFLERKSLEEQLRQTQKMEGLGVLAGGIAHDFNNLLTGIMGNASLALESVPSSHPSCRFLTDTLAAAQSAALLTSQMLAYAGKGQFTVEPLGLSELAGEITGLVRRSIPKGVDLQLELAEGLPAIEGDPAQLRQVIMNLVVNAAESIGEGREGTVLVSTAAGHLDAEMLRTCLAPGPVQPGKFVLIEVRDTGCGMDAETVSRIFEPFFTTKFMGRGLGLAAVLGIVQGHRGAMRVDSKPGQGTTFRVWFPASTKAVRSVPASATDNLAGAGAILVVDDEPMVRQTAQRGLERYGYKVQVAPDGDHAVAALRENPDGIDLVLLDLTMPGLSGEETLSQLQAIRPDIKVVLSTGYTEVEATSRFHGKGLAGFLQKPYTAARLAERIKAVLAADPPR